MIACLDGRDFENRRNPDNSGEVNGGKGLRQNVFEPEWSASNGYGDLNIFGHFREDFP